MVQLLLMKARPDASLAVLEQRNHPIVANCPRAVRVVTVADKATIMAVTLHQARVGGSNHIVPSLSSSVE